MNDPEYKEQRRAQQQAAYAKGGEASRAKSTASTRKYRDKKRLEKQGRKDQYVQTTLDMKLCVGPKGGRPSHDMRNN